MSKHTPQLEHKRRKATASYPKQRKQDTNPARCEQRRQSKRKHPVIGDLDELRLSNQQAPVQRMSRKDRRNARRKEHQMTRIA